MHKIVIGALLFLGAGIITWATRAELSAPSPIETSACLRKLSLDLTLRPPTAEQINAVQSGKRTLGELADMYLNSPEFAGVVFDWYREKFPPTDRTSKSIDVEEPARIAKFIVVNDRDYREILKGTYTVTANGQMQSRTGSSAGVISTAHYMSAYSGSFKRNWSGHYLKEWTGIVLEAVSVPDGTDISPAGIAKNKACANCHVHPIYGVDHLARFALCYADDGTYKADCAEQQGMFLTQTGKGLAELAAITADTHDFKAESVNFFFEKLYGRRMVKEEADYYTKAAQVFADSGYKVKALLKFLVTSQGYCSR